MTSPTSPLENALVLALEATERVLRASAPDFALAAPEVVDAAGAAHTFTVTGLGDGIMGIGSGEDPQLAALVADHGDDLAAAIGADLGAALSQSLTIASTGSEPAPVQELRSAVQVTVEGLEQPGVLWIAFDDDLGARIAETVRERLDDLGTEPAAPPPGNEPVEILDAEFPQMGTDSPNLGNHDLSLLSDVNLAITVELGRTTMRVRDLLELGAGSVVELDRSAGTPVDVLVNGTIVARGEVVVVDDELGVRVTEVIRQEAGAPT